MDWRQAAKSVPKSKGGNFYKFDDGQNKVRILSDPVMGWLYWTSQGKPVRLYEEPQQKPSDMREGDKIKFFWAFSVWSYRDGKVQVLEITQSSIREQMQDLILNEDWGDPKGYDLTVTKKGEKLDTEYTVQPSPQKVLTMEQVKAYREARVNLEALFAGGDPFADSSAPAEDVELDVADEKPEEDDLPL